MRWRSQAHAGQTAQTSATRMRSCLPFTVTMPATARPGTLHGRGRSRLGGVRRNASPSRALPAGAAGRSDTHCSDRQRSPTAFAPPRARMPRTPAWPARLQRAERAARCCSKSMVRRRRRHDQDAFWFPAAWGLIDHAAVQAVNADARTGRTAGAGARTSVFAADGARRRAGLRHTSGATSWCNAAPAHAAAAAGERCPGSRGFCSLAGGALRLRRRPAAEPDAYVFPGAGDQAPARSHGSPDVVRAQVRRSALRTAGVLAALLALAGTLLALPRAGRPHSAGASVQSPPFINC